MALPKSLDRKEVCQTRETSFSSGRPLELISGILFCSSIGSTALYEPLATMPVMTSTRSFFTSLVAAGTAVGGPSPSSPTESSTSRPPSLPSWVSR